MVEIYLVIEKPSEKIINYKYLTDKKKAIKHHKSGCKVITEKVPKSLTSA